MSVAQKSKVATAKVGRNDPCPCGSGKKFKQCCEGKTVPEFGVDAAVAPSWNIKARLEVHRRAANEHMRHEQWETPSISLKRSSRLDPDNSKFALQSRLRRDAARPACTGPSYRSKGRWRSSRAAKTRSARWPGPWKHTPGEERNAIGPYQKLSRKVSDPKLKMSYAAKALMLEGKTEEATELMRRVVALAPNDVETRVQLARLLTDRGCSTRPCRNTPGRWTPRPKIFAT